MPKFFPITLILIITLFSLHHCATMVPEPEEVSPVDSLVTLYSQAQYKEAVQYAGQLQGDIPDSARLYYYKGLAQLRLDRIDAALNTFETARSKKPNSRMDSIYASLLIDKASTAYQDQQFDRSIALAQDAISIQEKNRNAYYYKFMSEGRKLYQKGSDWELWDAVVAFGRAAEMQPRNPMPHYYMAKSYFKKDDQDFENIIREFEIAMKEGPPGDLREEIEAELQELRRRKKLYEDFWGN